MPLGPDALTALAAAGWQLSRDGSTATAYFGWDDPDDAESGWELMVLSTAGHSPRFTLEAYRSGLTERPAADLHRLRAALEQAAELLVGWQGELPPDAD